jgi:hypothetical protein
LTNGEVGGADQGLLRGLKNGVGGAVDICENGVFAPATLSVTALSVGFTGMGFTILVDCGLVADVDSPRAPADALNMPDSKLKEGNAMIVKQPVTLIGDLQNVV